MLQKVELIPWDPTDEGQYRRMHDQRVACGWREKEVSAWREQHLGGTKALYWICLSGHLQDQENLLGRHIERFPQEQEPITDTATKVFQTPRDPTNKSFVPIGHTALEPLSPAEMAELSLPETTVWVKYLYISRALQAGGIGRSAMLETERLASSPPINARVVALDTMEREFQLSTKFLELVYDERGLERPEAVRSNEEWYTRQGYVRLGHQTYYEWKSEGTGEVTMVPVVYMKKSLI